MSGIHDATTPMHLTDGEDVGTTQTIPSGIIRWEDPPARGTARYQKVEVREHSIPDAETRVYARYNG